MYDFNLKDKFYTSFELFKSMFQPIIGEIHVKLASSNNLNDVKKEALMAQFEQSNYNIVFSKVKQWEKQNTIYRQKNFNRKINYHFRIIKK